MIVDFFACTEDRCILKNDSGSLVSCVAAALSNVVSLLEQISVSLQTQNAAIDMANAFLPLIP